MKIEESFLPPCAYCEAIKYQEQQKAANFDYCKPTLCNDHNAVFFLIGIYCVQKHPCYRVNSIWDNATQGHQLYSMSEILWHESQQMEVSDWYKLYYSKYASITTPEWPELKFWRSIRDGSRTL